jgi:hypothetical protein
MNKESKTPRTDIWRYDQECNYEVTWDDNCEQLELELNEVTKQRHKLIDTLEYIAYSELSARHLVDVALETLKEINNKQHE